MRDVKTFVGSTLVDASAGQLGPLTLPSLIHDVCEEKNTGYLSVRDGDIEKSIYVDSGHIVFARSNDKEDRLGSLLIKRGMVSARQMEEAVRASQESGKRLGGVLVEHRMIRPQDLTWGVREQVKEIVVGLFSWTHGSYEMHFGPLPTEEVITLKMSTGDVILEGVKGIHEWIRIQLAVGGLDARYQVSSRLDELGRAMNLSLDEWTLLSRCEQPVDLGALCETSPMKDFDVCRLVWAFTVVGMLSRLS
ncbi:MAG TPA: DUF4388 domain-containing protein [Verrucomicrobiae bacterium]|nr:DUF4388 domain-containing protein [Verrucomicrobiae bacterium]